MVCRRWHDKMRRSMRDSRERERSEIEREEEDKESEIAGGTSDYCHEILPLTLPFTSSLGGVLQCFGVPVHRCTGVLCTGVPVYRFGGVLV